MPRNNRNSTRRINRNSNPILVSQYSNMFSPNNIRNYLENRNRNSNNENAINNLNNRLNNNGVFNSVISQSSENTSNNEGVYNLSNNLKNLPYKNVKLKETVLLSNIQDGDEMVNFHNEYNFNRYYKRNEFNQLPGNRKKNPFTRKTIKPSNIKRYKAHLVGGRRTRKTNLRK
jgi:hypothetical protein